MLRDVYLLTPWGWGLATFPGLKSSRGGGWHLVFL